jgi:hypothetical protein
MFVQGEIALRSDRRCVVTVGLLFALGVSLHLTGLGEAVPLAPCRYFGYVYIDGSPAPINTEVKGSIDGVFYGTTKTLSNGAYSLIVNGDDDATPTKEGGVPNDLVFFWIGTEIASEYAVFAEGGNEEMDLNVYTSWQPPLLKINEIMPSPSSPPEWVELYNPTLNNVALDRYSISDNDGYRKDLGEYAMIYAQGFLVFNYPVSLPGKLVDSGDEIKLDWHSVYADQYITIDRVEYGSAGADETILSNAPCPGSDQSLALQPDGHDTDDPTHDFIVLTTPTPGGTNGSPPQIPGDINRDGIVDNLDLIELGNAYGSTKQDSNWNSYCDLNSDNVVNVPDLFILGKNYGRTT